jgi:DNA polymerase III delta subunit
LSVITVRIPKQVKRVLEKRRVNISQTVRTFLEEYVRDTEMKELAARLDTLKHRVGGKIEAETIARLVREDRKAR